MNSALPDVMIIVIVIHILDSVCRKGQHLLCHMSFQSLELTSGNQRFSNLFREK